MRHLHQVRADRLQQLARRRPHLLSVGQVTGILVGDASLQGTLGRAQSRLGEKLGDVLHNRREIARAVRVLGIVFQQFAVLLHHGAATGGVGDDRILRRLQHGADISPPHLLRLLAKSGVRLQRPAAALTLRNENVEAVLVQHSNRGFVQLGKGNAGDTPHVKQHPAADLPLAVVHPAHLRKEKFSVHLAAPALPLSPIPAA